MTAFLRCWMCLWLGVGLVPPTQVLCSEKNSRVITESTSLALNQKYYWNKFVQTSNGNKTDTFEVEYLEEALEEQGYYLQSLFLQYGENGTLSFVGLQKLLGSLGLGEVNMLEISHRHIKHGSSDAPHSPSLTVHPAPAVPSKAPQGDSLPFVTRWRGEDLEDSPDVLRRGRTGGGGDKGMVDSRVSRKPYPSQGQPQPDTPVFPLDHPAKNHVHGNCLNVTQLLWNFGLGQESHITPSHFTLLCPALLHQIDSRVCLRHSQENVLETQSHVAFLKALGWGSLALMVISLPSLLALGVVPLLPPAFLQNLLCPMAALAVGTLCGDALLHLLPHASPGPHSVSDQQDAVLKGLCVLAGLYLLFLVESIMGLQRHCKQKANVKVRKRHASEQDVMHGRELTALRGEGSAEEGQAPGSVTEESPRHSHGHGHSHLSQKQAGMGTLVWMVIMGDGIHNLTDGLAIGAAFSQSLAGGLSTTVAVFCHELPHELGDLTVLLAAGWPVRRLLIFSVLSAAFGFLGLLAGTFLGHYSEQLSPWILAITAGVFLHVALADMMPEMLHGGHGSTAPMTRFFLQNLGLLAGVSAMLCIALFEDNITFKLEDS